MRFQKTLTYVLVASHAVLMAAYGAIIVYQRAVSIGVACAVGASSCSVIAAVWVRAFVEARVALLAAQRDRVEAETAMALTAHKLLAQSQSVNLFGGDLRAPN